MYAGGYRKYFLMLTYELNSYWNSMEEKKHLFLKRCAPFATKPCCLHICLHNEVRVLSIRISIHISCISIIRILSLCISIIKILFILNRNCLAEILPIRRKPLFNQSIIYSDIRWCTQRFIEFTDESTNSWRFFSYQELIGEGEF